MLGKTLAASLIVGFLLPLRAQPGFADFRSSPSGAKIFIDDSLYGVTPLLASLPIGTHRAFLQSADGTTATLVIVTVQNEVSRHDVTFSSRTSLRSLLGVPAGDNDGKMTIVTDLPGAEVSIDGRPTGATTPVTIEEVPPGLHIVRAIAFLEKLQDQFSVAETVQVAAGQTTLVRIDFESSTVEGTLRLASNDPRLTLTLRHVDSGKRYTLRQVGDVRLVTGRYELEPSADSIGAPSASEPLRVVSDSVTYVFLPHLIRLLPQRRLEDHSSYVEVEEFLRRAFKPRPLSETRSELTMTQNFALWLGGGVSMILASEILDSEESIRRATNPSLSTIDNRVTYSALKGAGMTALLLGAALTSSIDTVHVDLSFNQQANQKDEEFLRARHVDLLKTWQRQIDQENKVIGAENERRSNANAALPKPSVRLMAP